MKVTGQQEAFCIIKRINQKKKVSKIPNPWCKEYMVKLEFPPAAAVLYEW